MEVPRDVSVVIPARGRPNLAARAVQSASSQSLPPIEVIVVDDGSSRPLGPLLTKLGSSSLKVTRYFPGVNAAHARNVGIDCASGAYVAFLDSDDWWLPGHLAGIVDLLESHGADCVLGSYRAVYGNGREEVRQAPTGPINSSEAMLRYLFRENGLCRMSTMAATRAILDRVRFDARLGKHQDWDFAVALAGKGKVFYNQNADVCVDYGASGRMSGSTNPESTLRFLEKYQSIMAPGTTNGFLLRVALSAMLRQDQKAVAKILHNLRTPPSLKERAKSTVIKAMVRIPGLPGLLTKVYLMGLRLRHSIIR